MDESPTSFHLLINIQTGELIVVFQLLFFYSTLSELLSFSGPLSGITACMTDVHQSLTVDQTHGAGTGGLIVALVVLL
jgi:hypothetical protein